ncbi:MAG: YcxB family protein [Chitinophagaceae bacterium]|nr:YcxB family protein [Chitinophagaceae bacterium]
MTIHFSYEKPKVLQALRYHFISRKEIRFMLILVNAFAIMSLILYALRKVTSSVFVTGAFLWILLMASFWFFLPLIVYNRAVTFKHRFSMSFYDEGFELRHENGSKAWRWTSLNHYLETPHFFHLYFDAQSFFLVPKNACKNSDEVHALRKLIQSKVKKG